MRLAKGGDEAKKDLTLTRVVFEFFCIFSTCSSFRDLTLTRVVFE